MPKYDIPVKLTGSDGNAFSIMAKVKQAMKKNGVPKEEIDKYVVESMSGDYDNLLCVAMKYVNVE
jgi:hypothetical protein